AEVEELDVLAKALLPTLAAAVAAGGAIVTSGMQQVGTVFFANLLLTLIRQVLMPLVYCYIAAVTANAVLPQQILKGLAQAMRKGITWLLTGSLVLFTGYLSITGAAAASADKVTLQLTRSAISTAVPVVGGIISRAADSLLAGAGLLKNALGVVGMLAVLATCLTPFVSMGVQYLLYKLTAFLAGLSGGGRVVELIDALGSAFGLVLGMVGACAALLLISVTSSVSVVIV
ncbi:MAG: stage III sporulation protein AE, partial [Oscillospiraceae bacterium]|nr:stage III sporulation protein AE [Oscillospiraceae bacterium]